MAIRRGGLRDDVGEVLPPQDVQEIGAARVVVARGVDGRDASFPGPGERLAEEALGLDRNPIPIDQVAGNQNASTLRAAAISIASRTRPWTPSEAPPARLPSVRRRRHRDGCLRDAESACEWSLRIADELYTDRQRRAAEPSDRNAGKQIDRRGDAISEGGRSANRSLLISQEIYPGSRARKFSNATAASVTEDRTTARPPPTRRLPPQRSPAASPAGRQRTSSPRTRPRVRKDRPNPLERNDSIRGRRSPRLPAPTRPRGATWPPRSRSREAHRRTTLHRHVRTVPTRRLHRLRGMEAVVLRQGPPTVPPEARPPTIRLFVASRTGDGLWWATACLEKARTGWRQAESYWGPGPPTPPGPPGWTIRPTSSS
jgi:hypothetical protein